MSVHTTTKVEIDFKAWDVWNAEIQGLVSVDQYKKGSNWGQLVYPWSGGPIFTQSFKVVK